jgi:radical SAM superfamily enzyme YgiQ (UPF0313 family)
MMTYWYPGVREAIGVVREVFPRVPVLLGGIYATLCPEHAAAHCGADRVCPGAGEAAVLPLADAYTGYIADAAVDPSQPDSWPYPAFELLRRIAYIPLLTSTGCPYDCAYCAARYLWTRRTVRSPRAVVEEIRYWRRDFGVRDYVFYDDALLVNAARHAVPLLEQIVRARLGVRFHTPNALHVREIAPETARLMFAAGFRTVRLGLETAEFVQERRLDRKVTRREFQRAVESLKGAGFTSRQVGAYLLVGLPGQSLTAIAESIAVVKAAGIVPIPAYYAPIPHTRLWPEACKASRYPLEEDPVYSNNALLPCQQAEFSWDTLARIKRLADDG